MNKSLPPPVTRESPKSDLWRELQATITEVNSQQNFIRRQTAEIAALRDTNRLMTYQLGMVRQALTVTFEMSGRAT